jgi:hypothetical protein
MRLKSRYDYDFCGLVGCKNAGKANHYFPQKLSDIGVSVSEVSIIAMSLIQIFWVND